MSRQRAHSASRRTSRIVRTAVLGGGTAGCIVASWVRLGMAHPGGAATVPILVALGFPIAFAGWTTRDDRAAQGACRIAAVAVIIYVAAVAGAYGALTAVLLDRAGVPAALLAAAGVVTLAGKKRQPDGRI